MKQVQASSGLLYDVFVKYDPGNLLLHQAQREVLERQLEASRIGRVLDRLMQGTVRLVETERFTPFAFPLVVDSTRAKVSSERMGDRIRRMASAAEEPATKKRASSAASRTRAQQVFNMSSLRRERRSQSMSEVGTLETVVAGEHVILFPERGLLVPASNTAVVADLHWGKAAAFRAQHVPVPAGTTRADVDRLSRFILRSRADTLVVLGDLFHARAGKQPRTLAVLHEWRREHADLRVILIRGNHDSHAGDPPASLDIECVDGPWTLGPFTCEHVPAHRDGEYVLAGHLHPSVSLTGRARERLRLCCFAFGPAVGVLPAFSSFTGGGMYERTADDAIFAIAEDDVIELPALVRNQLSEKR